MTFCPIISKEFGMAVAVLESYFTSVLTSVARNIGQEILRLGKFEGYCRISPPLPGHVGKPSAVRAELPWEPGKAAV
jgi:hypothetical protein